VEGVVPPGGRHPTFYKRATVELAGNLVSLCDSSVKPAMQWGDYPALSPCEHTLLIEIAI